MSDKKDNSGEVNRRRLLRGAGAAVAGAVGAGVAASVATPANAAAGDPVLAGQTNDAGTASTTLTTSTDAGATLVLNNAEGPQLTLGAATQFPAQPDTQPAGSVLADSFGNVFTNQVFTDDAGNPENFYTRVLTDGWATQVFPIDPVRVLDTRNAALRGRLISGNKDSSGRLLAGQTGLLDISDQVDGAVAAQINITVVNAAAAGYVTVWSGATTRPASSSINYQATTALSNFGQTVVGFIDNTRHDLFAIFTSQTTHVLIDIVGYIMFSSSQIITPAAKTPNTVTPEVKGRNMATLNALRNANRPQIKR